MYSPLVWKSSVDSALLPHCIFLEYKVKDMESLLFFFIAGQLRMIEITSNAAKSLAASES